jgi:NAD(P)-dependent dehydrogenase (short-subunit alcohol dehydrogenase family)
MGSGADYYRDRHVVVTGGTGALGTAMVGALLEGRRRTGASVFARSRGSRPTVAHRIGRRFISNA